MKKNSNNSSKQFKRSTLLGLVIALAAVVVINILSSYLFFRIDLTKDKRHSLSPSTIEMLKNLDDRVYFRVYLKGKDQPADYQLFAKQVEQMLQDFRSYSKNVYFEFIDPLEGAHEVTPPGSTILLFGSQARGDARPDSDWDLLILVKKDRLAPEDFSHYAYPFMLLGFDNDAMVNPPRPSGSS